jgi:hypothetical protein
LFLMNHPFVVKQAQALADRVEKELPDNIARRVDRLYRLLYGRNPNEKEMALAQSAATRWQDYCHTLLCANEFLYLD